MRFFEFVEPAEEDAQVASIIAVSNQLQQHVEDETVNTDDFMVDDLLDLFQANGVILDVQDLYTMIDKPLLKGIISNIEGDKIVFKGHEPVNIDPDDSKSDGESTVANMAKSAQTSPEFKI